MNYKINTRYSIGDEVRYTGTSRHIVYNSHWNDPIPEEDNHWKIDGYGIFIEENKISVKYCFHAYCNKYFEYHDLVDESELEPISEPHPTTMEWEPEDVFGNPIEFNDMVYYDFYTKSQYLDPPNVPTCVNMIAFQNRGYVKMFIKSKNLMGLYDECVRFEDTGEVYGYASNKTEPLCSIMVKSPKTFVNDMAELGLRRGLEDKYDMDKFKRMTGWLGVTDKCLEKYEKLKNKREKERERTRERRSKKPFNAKSVLEGLSDEEKKELLKELIK